MSTDFILGFFFSIKIYRIIYKSGLIFNCVFICHFVILVWVLNMIKYFDMQRMNLNNGRERLAAHLQTDSTAYTLPCLICFFVFYVHLFQPLQVSYFNLMPPLSIYDTSIEMVLAVPTYFNHSLNYEFKRNLEPTCPITY